MSTKLGEDLLDLYQQQGFLFPLPALSSSEISTLRTKLEELEEKQGGKLPPHINRKSHLPITWLNELIRNDRILEAVEKIIGPDILCWGLGSSSRTRMIRHASPGIRIRRIGAVVAGYRDSMGSFHAEHHFKRMYARCAGDTHVAATSA